MAPYFVVVSPLAVRFFAALRSFKLANINSI